VSREATSVNSRNSGNAFLAKVIIQIIFATPIRAASSQLADYDTFTKRAAGLCVGTRNAIVPNVWICEVDDLSGVRRVAYYFLVAAKNSIEDDFSRSDLDFGPNQFAFEDGAICENERSLTNPTHVITSPFGTGHAVVAAVMPN
jgi:hypothetical protein